MTALAGPGVRAVVIGTGSHPDDSVLADVPQAVAAAHAVGECLIRNCGLQPENLRVVPDPAKSNDLERLIARFSREADSLLLIYYVGHGLLDAEGKLHLAISETRDHSPAHGESLPYEVVRRAVEDSTGGGGRPTIIILDCCYAGTATQQFTLAAQSGYAQSSVAGAYILMSSSGHEQSWCLKDAIYPVFSQVLMDILRKGAPGLGPKLNLDEVYRELKNRLHRLGAPEARCHAQDSINQLVLAPNQAFHQPKAPHPRPEGESSLPYDTCPYKDLDSYDVDDHELFFGRDQPVADLVAKLATRHGTGGIELVAGPSGVGKSSLLRAGVFHQIGRGALGIAGSARWPRVVLTPKEHPLLTLAEWISARLPADTARGPDIRIVRERLLAAPSTFAELVAKLPAALPDQDTCRAIILVDQLEQVFAPEVDEVERNAFLAALNSVAARRVDKPPVALVIAAIRSDFLGMYQEYAEVAGSTGENVSLVYPMDRDDLIAVIEQPARRAGLALGHGFVEELLRDVDEHTVAGPSPVRARSVLPHLSHALWATWMVREEAAERSADGTERKWCVLTLAGYRDSGGILRALSTTAEQAYGKLPEAALDAAPKMFVSLVRSVRMGDLVVETGRSVSRDELVAVAGAAAVDKILATFVEQRLLTTGKEGIAFAHEAVIASWARLGGWIAQEREWLDVRRDVEEEAAKWQRVRAGRRSAEREFLLQSSRLESVRETISKAGHTEADLSSSSREFLRSSQRARTRRVRIRQGVVAALVVLALISAGFAISANVNARAAVSARAEADSRAAASDALRQRAVDPAVAAQLAIAAYRISPTGEARGALLSTSSMPPVTRVEDHVGPHHGTLAVARAHHGPTLATGGADGAVTLWDAADPARPAVLARFPAADRYPIFTLDFSPDDKILALGAYDGRVDLWDVEDRRAPRLLAHVPTRQNRQVFTVAFSPDGRTLVSGSTADNALHLWDMTNPRKPVQLSKLATGSVGAPYKVVFAPDGRTLAVCDSGDPVIRLIDLAVPKRPSVLRLLKGHQGAVEALAFSPDGRTLASAAQDNAVRLWDVSTPAKAAPRGQPLIGHTNAIYALAFSPDGSRLTSGGNDNSVRIWDAASGRAMATLPHPQSIQAIVFLDAGEIATGGNDGLLRLWHLPGRMLLGPSGQIASVVFSPDGRTLAEGDSDGLLWLWNVTDPTHPTLYGPPVRTARKRERSGINRMAFSPDGHLLALPCNSGVIELWNVTDPRHPFRAGPRLTGHTKDVDTVAFAAGGHILASSSNDTSLRLWDVSDPQAAHPIGDALASGNGAIFEVATSPDGRILVAGGGNATIGRWDVSRPERPVSLGEPLRVHTEAVLGLAFDRTGRTLASAGADGVVRLWDMTDPRHPVLDPIPLRNAGSPITEIAFSRGGDLAMANADNSIWLWKNDGGRYTLSARLTGHSQSAYYAAFSPDGGSLATSSIDPTALLWTTSPDRVVKDVCAVVGTPLTPAERELFLPDNKNQKICS